MRKFFLLWFGISSMISVGQISPLDTIEISSARVPISQQQSGKSITIIEGKSLTQLPINTLDDLLKYIPGVEVQTRNGFGAQADITMRGSTFAQVLMLIDGVRINDPLTGHFNLYLPISPSEISRIEIVRGASSAIFGPDAVGGVVHIITKNFELQPSNEGSNGEIQAAYGEYGLTSIQAGGNLAGPKFQIGGGINWNQSTGQPLPPDTIDLRNDFQTFTSSASFRYTPAPDWQISARAGLDSRTFNARYFYTRSPFDESREQTFQLFGQGRIAKTHQNGKTYLDFAYKIMRDSFLFNPAFPANIHETRFGIVQLNHLREISKSTSINFGIQADQRNIESTDRGDHQDVHVGAYAIAASRFQNGLTLNGSVRLDYDENYGIEFLPQLNMSYNQKWGTLRGSFGRAIRAADYTERYISNQLENLAPGRNLGNRDLNAEESWYAEIGADLSLAEGIVLSSTPFFRRDNNLIDYVLTPYEEIPFQDNLQVGAEYLFAQNIVAVNTWGWENILSANWSMASWTVNGQIGYQYLYSDASTDRAAKYISNRARHLWNGMITANRNRWTISISTGGKVRDESEATEIQAELNSFYWIWNGKVSYQIIPGKLSVFGQGYNLTNQSYQDILGAYLPQRWLMGGIQFFQ